jgi:hypothetical protein
VLLGRGKHDVDVRQIPEMLKTETGRTQVGKYCLEDARLTWDLYTIMAPYFGLGR